MELVAAKLDLFQLLVSDLDASGISLRVQFRMNFEAGSGRGSGDEVHDRFEAAQRLAAPVLTDIGKQPVLNFIPLAGAQRKVTDGNRQPGLVGQLLQRDFPKPQAGNHCCLHHRR